MVSGRMIVAVLVAAAIAATLFVPFNAAVTENSGDVDVENESISAELDTYQNLDGYDINSGSETVRWHNGTDYVTLSSGSDYEMRYDGGEINVSSSSNVSQGDEVLVSYTYSATDGTTGAILDLAPLFLALLILVVLAKPMMEAL